MSNGDNGSDITAAWLKALTKSLRQGLHVILHGNVSDVVMRAGRLLSSRDAVDETLAECGYTIRCTHTIPDGITFSHPDMLHEFQRIDRTSLVRRTPTPVPANPVPAGPAFDTAAASGESGSANGSGAAAFAPERQNAGILAGPRNIGPALSSIRTVLGTDSGEAVAAQIIFSDKLHMGNDNCPLDERNWMETIRLTMDGAWLHVNLPQERQHLEGMRNVLILVADDLKSLPQWLHVANPRVRLVPVGLPAPDERRAFLRQRWSGFYGCDEVELTTARSDEFVALTDGLTMIGMESLRMCSIEERLSVADLRRMVDFFRHGVKQNPWKLFGPTLLTDAAEKIGRRVIGQDAAVRSALNVLTQAIGGIALNSSGNRTNGPKGCLLLVGPTGVGKTELARALAEVLFGDIRAIKSFDMGEFQQEHSHMRLIGSPPSYVGYGQGGELTNHVLQRPFSVLLFDEIEKAHARIWNLFLGILEEGRLTDSTGQTAHFSNSLIIFTSNIGCTMSENLDGHTVVSRSALDYRALTTYEAVQRHFKAAVRDFFIGIGRMEMFGRIGQENIVVFDLIREQHIRGIVEKLLLSVAASAMEERSCNVTFDASLTEVLVRQSQQDSDVLQLGGRGIRNLIMNTVVLALNKAVVANPHCAGLCVSASQTEIIVTGDAADVRIALPTHSRGQTL